MYKHHFQKRVRYGETDRMGYLYYGHYALLYEIGRTESIRSLGITYKDLEDQLGIMMPVLAVESRFLAPVHYDELITIETIIEEMPSKMVTFHTNIINEAGKIVHRGWSKLFFVDMKTNKRVPPPIAFTNKLKTYFEK